MSKVITYVCGDGLYLNLTNRCPNACEFCVRDIHDSVGDADSLWLDAEPTLEEAMASIDERDLSSYREVVFCGFGEPFCRYNDMVELCRYIKEKRNIPIRINTNGLGSLICGKNPLPDLRGLADQLSISLNAPTAAEYDAICHPEYGSEAFESLLDFAQEGVRLGFEVIMTVVSTMDEEKIEQCRTLCESIGARFRVREIIT